MVNSTVWMNSVGSPWDPNPSLAGYGCVTYLAVYSFSQIIDADSCALTIMTINQYTNIKFSLKRLTHTVTGRQEIILIANV